MSAGVFKFMGAKFEILRDRHDLGENYGLCQYGSRRMKIKAGLSPRDRASTMIHEMTHAILDRLGLWLNEDEELVRRIEGIVEAVIAENATLVREIVDDIAGPKRKKR